MFLQLLPMMHQDFEEECAPSSRRSAPRTSRAGDGRSFVELGLARSASIAEVTPLAGDWPAMPIPTWAATRIEIGRSMPAPSTPPSAT
ncbi:MAG: hypothetical protein R2705_03855 [Ilumatobacteraceae bacterium]